jgi:predicted dithiol-disulfide oxidoreductase (DUF899 family)
VTNSAETIGVRRANECPGPLAKLDAYKAEKKWSISWFSSFASDFNYDFHVTLDPKVAPADYNYRNKAEMAAAKGHPVLMEGE